MSYSLRPARRSEAKPLIGLYSESGCGKTLSALFLARGFVGPKGRIGMIETEAGRGEAYADTLPGSYEVIPMREDFSPKNYGDAISAAENAKLDALIIDSASHEWEGAGGVLMMAAKNQAEGKKGPMVWQLPKMDHQRHFMLRLMSTPIPLVIVCMRAKYPMEEKITDGKKEWTRSTNLDPKQSDDILFEMFVHGWIDQKHNFHGTKYTLDSLKSVLVDGKPLSIATGEVLAEWARGGSGDSASGAGVTLIKGEQSAPTVSTVPPPVPPGEEPACKGCSSDQEEILMQFVPSGKTDRGTEFAAFWRCPKGNKDHKPVKHSDYLAKLAEIHKATDNL